jgi:hypothetical protein
MVYVLGIGGYADGSTEALRGLAEQAKKYDAKTLLIESNYGGQTFGETLRSFCIDIEHPVSVEYIRATAQKELRIIRTLEPILASHRMVISSDALRQDYNSAKNYGGENWMFRSLMYQLTRITRDRGCIAHDDRVDAVSQACEFLGNFSLSPNTRDHREAERKRRFRPRGRREIMLDGPGPEKVAMSKARKILRG